MEKPEVEFYSEDERNELIQYIADHAKKVGDNTLAIICYAYIASAKMGNPNELASHVQDFCKQQVFRINRGGEH